MATNWPNSVQTFTNPTAGSALNSPSHADQHTTVNDEVTVMTSEEWSAWIDQQVGTEKPEKEPTP